MGPAACFPEHVTCGRVVLVLGGRLRVVDDVERRDPPYRVAVPGPTTVLVSVSGGRPRNGEAAPTVRRRGTRSTGNPPRLCRPANGFRGVRTPRHSHEFPSEQGERGSPDARRLRGFGFFPTLFEARYAKGAPDEGKVGSGLAGASSIRSPAEARVEGVPFVRGVGFVIVYAPSMKSRRISIFSRSVRSS